jgi:Flp pilus assembly protein TadD
MTLEHSEEARQYYLKVVSINAKNTKVILNLGTLETIACNYDKAIEYF